MEIRRWRRQAYRASDAGVLDRKTRDPKRQPTLQRRIAVALGGLEGTRSRSGGHASVHRRRRNRLPEPQGIGGSHRAEKGLNEIIGRMRFAIAGVDDESRQGLEEGASRNDSAP